MRRIMLVLAVVTLVPSAASATATRPARRARIVVSAVRPASPFECGTARATEWYGSPARCLEELCRGRNVTNAYVEGPGGRLVRNPCHFSRPRE